MSVKNVKPGKKPKKKGKKPYGEYTFLYIAFAFFVILVGFRLFEEVGKTEPLTISDVAQKIDAGEVAAIRVNGSVVSVEFNDEEVEPQTLTKEPGSSFDEALLRHGVTTEGLQGIVYEAGNPTGFRYWFAVFAPFIVPLILIGLIVWFLFGNMKGVGGAQAFTFGRSRAQEIDPNNKEMRVTFADVAGAEEAKQDLLEYVDFLKHPQKYIAIGAKVPRGVLLSGAPGTGKTLLARAVAGEAGVPFFSVSGSEFVEMFVGVGAARVRDLFKNAKTKSPSIIFIDEIDAIGRARASGFGGGGNDEREQALNQILVEMDGFEISDKVVVMAATNRVDVLDTALVRPGRFDRKIVVPLPDKKEREHILRVHAREKKCADDVDFETIARRTIGFSGADLAAIINEAAIRAVRKKRKELTQEDLMESIEKVMLGPERTSRLVNKREREIIAYHEAGHALLGSIMKHADPVEKISIISRGHVGGYVMSIPTQEKTLRSRQEFFDMIVVLLGGYTAERVVFGETTTGPSNDLERIGQIAHDMVTRFGMSATVGPVSLHKVRVGAMGYPQDMRSETMEKKIDAEVEAIIMDAQKVALKHIEANRKALDRIVKELFEKETLERAEFEKVLEEEGVQIETEDGGTVSDRSDQDDIRA